MHISSSIPYITFGWHNLLFQTQHRISNETKLHSLQDDRKRQALTGWPRKGRRKYRKRAWQRSVHLVEECGVRQVLSNACTRADVLRHGSTLRASWQNKSDPRPDLQQLWTAESSVAKTTPERRGGLSVVQVWGRRGCFSCASYAGFLKY